MWKSIFSIDLVKIGGLNCSLKNDQCDQQKDYNDSGSELSRWKKKNHVFECLVEVRF